MDRFSPASSLPGSGTAAPHLEALLEDTAMAETAASSLRRPPHAARPPSSGRVRPSLASIGPANPSVSFRTVAARAGVSRSWLYREPAIRAEIQRLSAHHGTVRSAAVCRATPDLLRQRADALRVEVNDLRTENRRSREHSLAVSDSNTRWRQDHDTNACGAADATRGSR